MIEETFIKALDIRGACVNDGTRQIVVTEHNENVSILVSDSAGNVASMTITRFDWDEIVGKLNA